MIAFADLPFTKRFKLRAAIENAGGNVEGYYGVFVLVAIPRPATGFFTAMEAAGLELDEESLHLFPLGSDAPPESLRHSCSKYVPELSFWLYGKFHPKADATIE